MKRLETGRWGVCKQEVGSSVFRQIQGWVVMTRLFISQSSFVSLKPIKRASFQSVSLTFLIY